MSSPVANVVRGPAGLEAGFVTKLFIIQLKLKVKRTQKGFLRQKGQSQVVTLKLTLLFLVSTIQVPAFSKGLEVILG